jgi:hypothetical protein
MPGINLVPVCFDRIAAMALSPLRMASSRCGDVAMTCPDFSVHS